MRFPLLLALSLSLAACSSDPPPSCTPGAQLACACPGGAASVQVCGASGVLGFCACPDGGGLDVVTDVETGAGDVPALDVATLDAGEDRPSTDTPAIADVDVPESLDAASAHDASDATVSDVAGMDARTDVGALDVPAVDVPRDVFPDGCASTTPGNCCGIACATPAHGTASCSGGRCGIGTCQPGYGDCDGFATNGCETSLSTSAANCGACGAPCAEGRVCVGAACVPAPCAAPFLDCDHDSAGSCEVDTSLDNDNCGACGRACGAGRVCAGGVCQGTCATGTALCGGRCVNTRTGLDHCGGCSIVCPARPASTRTCVSGACGIACNAGRGDCDGNVTNGCEADLSSDVNNCTACGMRCAFCVAGICVP